MLLKITQPVRLLPLNKDTHTPTSIFPGDLFTEELEEILVAFRPTGDGVKHLVAAFEQAVLSPNQPTSAFDAEYTETTDEEEIV